MGGSGRPPGRGPSRALIAWVVAAATALSGCGTGASPTPPGTFGPPTSATPAATPTPTLPPTPVASGAVAIDSALLAVLPSTVDGIPLEETRDEEVAALADPLLAAVGSAIASGLAIDPGSGEFVYAVVVRLKPGVMTDAAFRDWRDSYDEGACSQAGGTGGNAEAEIDGRTVYIGTCAGGVRTYHVWLQVEGLLVSASAVGERRLGEQLVENLQP